MPVGGHGGLHRHVFDLRVEIFFLLITVDIQMLLEIALVVEQSDGDQRHAQPAGAFNMVAREHAQAAGVNRHRFVQAELGGKIRHRLGAQHAGMRGAPRGARANVFLQAAIRLIDAAVQHQFRRPHLEPFRRELGQQRDGIVIELPPANRIEIAKQIHDVGMPTPPQIPSDGQTLFVQCLRREFDQTGFGRRRGAFDGLKFGLAHAKFSAAFRQSARPRGNQGRTGIITRLYRMILDHATPVCCPQSTTIEYHVAAKSMVRKHGETRSSHVAR